MIFESRRHHFRKLSASLKKIIGTKLKNDSDFAGMSKKTCFFCSGLNFCIFYYFTIYQKVILFLDSEILIFRPGGRKGRKFDSLTENLLPVEQMLS